MVDNLVRLSPRLMYPLHVVTCCNFAEASLQLLRTVAHFWTTARALRSLLPLRCSFIVQVAQGHTCWVCPGLYLLAHYVICYAGFICSREVRGTGRFRDHLPMFIRRSPSHTSGHPILNYRLCYSFRLC